MATSRLRDVVSGRLLVKMQRVTEYLVIGVDVSAPSDRGHAYGETAIVFDVQRAEVVGATGKTYPNVERQGHLIRNADASNHQMVVGEEPVAVLVCHDLIAFGNRSVTNRRGRRARVADELGAAAMSRDAAVLLHLPHTIDRASTWAPSWKRLLDRFGSDRPVWASSIKYRTVGDDHRPRRPLEHKLLDATSSGGDGVLDIVLGDHRDL